MNWDEIANSVNQVVTLLKPVLSVILPGSSVAINIGESIIQGVIAAEPAALALFNQITSGKPVTAEQLQAYIADNDAANAELQAAIAKKLAELDAKTV